MAPIFSRNTPSLSTGDAIGIGIICLAAAVLLSIAAIALYKYWKRQSNQLVLFSSSRRASMDSFVSDGTKRQSSSSNGTLRPATSPHETSQHRSDGSASLVSYHSISYNEDSDTPVRSSISMTSVSIPTAQMNQSYTQTPIIQESRNVPPIITDLPPVRQIHARDTYPKQPWDATTSASTDTESMYSQASASASLHHPNFSAEIPPPVPPIPDAYKVDVPPRLQLPSPEYDNEEVSLIRGNTKMLSQLLKTRARRAGKVKTNGTVEQIERVGSLRDSEESPSSAEGHMPEEVDFDDDVKTIRLVQQKKSVSEYCGRWEA